jgi:N-acetylmuramoyl-L-alanine amidase
MSYRVFIGVGHGGSDPGASRYVVEKEANLTIALELRKQLEAAGIVVGMSRTKDENDPIGEEIREANAFAPIDIAVEIHNNAGNGDGFEVFVQTNQYAAKSRAAAQAIEAEVKAIGQRSRGIKNKVYGWTYSVKAPAVLLEGFFVDNKADAADFDTVAEQQELGRAYARGVLKYLGVEAKPVTPAKENYTVTASGQFDSKAAADTALANIKKLGFTGAVAKTTESANEKVLTKGSVVRMKAGAKYYDGETPLAFVYNRDHVVRSIAGNRVVITYNGSVIGAVHKDNLILVK